MIDGINDSITPSLLIIEGQNEKIGKMQT